MKKIEEDCSKGVTNFTDLSTGNQNSALFTQIPLPPSSNNQYYLARRGDKTYYIPSDELKRFKDKMRDYPMVRPNEFMMAKHKVQGWVNNSNVLEIRAVFFFKRSRILTLANRPKRLDCSNRIKALHDQLSKLIGIDDCWFFRVYAEKVMCNETMEEGCCVEIMPIT